MPGLVPQYDFVIDAGDLEPGTSFTLRLETSQWLWGWAQGSESCSVRQSGLGATQFSCTVTAERQARFSLFVWPGRGELMLNISRGGEQAEPFVFRIR